MSNMLQEYNLYFSMNNCVNVFNEARCVCWFFLNYIQSQISTVEKDF